MEGQKALKKNTCSFINYGILAFLKSNCLTLAVELDVKVAKAIVNLTWLFKGHRVQGSFLGGL